MEVNINDNSIHAVAFAKNWLTKRDNPQTVHDENWDMFAQILADDVAKVINHRIKILVEKNERFLRENATPPIKGK